MVMLWLVVCLITGVIATAGDELVFFIDADVVGITGFTIFGNWKWFIFRACCRQCITGPLLSATSKFAL